MENEKKTIDQFSSRQENETFSAYFLRIMGYRNTYQFIKEIIFDIALISTVIYFGIVLSQMVLVCPGGQPGYLATQNISEIYNNFTLS